MVAFDAQGHKYDFSHAVLITTTLGSDRIVSLMQAHVHETNKTLVVRIGFERSSAEESTVLSIIFARTLR